MKKTFNTLSILMLLCSCHQNYGWYELETSASLNKTTNRYELRYDWNHKNSNGKQFVLHSFNYQEMDIDYILIGDVINVKAYSIIEGVHMSNTYGRAFNDVKKVKIDRAKTFDFEVISYDNNGKEAKKIVCEKDNINFSRNYTDNNQIILL